MSEVKKKKEIPKWPNGQLSESTRSLKQRKYWWEGNEIQPGFLSSCVVGMCVLEIAIFEVDASLKWIPL